jgi:type I restriction enzyme R subunit
VTGGYSEDALVEQPAIALFAELGWETADCFHEFQHGKSPLGRENMGEVVLVSRLRPALQRLNPQLTGEAIDLAIEELTRDRSLLTLAAANRQIYDLLKDGMKVTFRGEDGEQTHERVRLLDWNEPFNNDFFLASQFWVTGEMYTRRTDLIGFVNGLPLVLVELKASHKQLKTAYTHNLTDYKDTIPHLFWYNAFIILSNGGESKIGTVTAAWEHFADWKKINSEGEEGIVSLATMIRGTCEPARLLDIVENFALFMEVQGGLIKLVAKNHQYLGVNTAIDGIREISNTKGRLGVFWHTQGSGKSVSMIFFAQKTLRKLPGNWTFVVVTDRQELDDQIYKNFANSGVLTEAKAQARSSAHLRRLLTEDHRYVFTLIHKFRTTDGKKHPVLSERSDIIVITDEAHRSQYDALALNMRTALPNASFIAFTGTPLIIGEEKTRGVFGDYVSIYNFKQSVDDRATVPLYYENRIPELQLANRDFKEDMQRLLEEAELDEEQERKLEREFSRQYHLITRDERLETIAKDIVAHFTGRGYQGKAMVVSIDKATAIRMYDKVQKYWRLHLVKLREKLENTVDFDEKAEVHEAIRYMEETDMAVVVSQSQNEVTEMKKKGLDIAPHRKRMVTEALDTKFKDASDLFRIVFVCAMWMTGFDVPSCSTIYLDKPMRNHTLMQTIARANRVFGEKVNGLIVDYIGVFRDLQKALAIYGSGSGGGVEPGDSPVFDKAALVERLKEAIDETASFCTGLGIDLNAILAAEAFVKVKLLDDATNAIVSTEEYKKQYLFMANSVSALLKAVMPDPVANDLKPMCTLLHVIAEKIRALTAPTDISGVMSQVEKLLDESVATQAYEIRESGAAYGEDRLIDLSKLDFDALKAKFDRARKYIEAERLKNLLSAKLATMVKLNRSRMDYQERLQRMIDDYNAGSLNIDEFFKQLVEFAQSLNEEDKRGIAEGLSEEELAVFDLLTKPEMKLTEKEKRQVKKVSRDLLGTLKREKLVLDWRKHQQSRAAVRVAIEEFLDQLPDTYTTDIFQQKCELVYQHVYESYYGAGRSLYG